MTVFGVGISKQDLVETLNTLDWQESVLDRYDPTSALPSSPSIKDRYLATATGNGWTDKNIYEWDGTSWEEIIPDEGFVTFVEDEDKEYIYKNGAWSESSSGSSVGGYTHTQSVASTTWTIVHNLGIQYVDVTFYDSSDQVIIPDTVTATSSTTTTATFATSRTGKAVVTAPAISSQVNTYLHTQSSSNTTWTVSHGLGTSNPIIQVFDSSDEVILPESAVVTDTNTVTLTFSSGITGKCRILGTGATSVNTADTISELNSGEGVTIGDELKIAAGLTINRTATATSANASVDDCYIGVTNTDAARTITLLTAAVSAGKAYIIKDESGGASSNNITIATEGSEKIDGQDTYVISSNYGSITAVSNGTNWFIV